MRAAHSPLTRSRSPPSNASSRSAATTCSSSATLIRITPWVARPAMRISLDAGADQLALVGDQQQFLVLVHRERRDDARVAGEAVGDQAFAAAPGDPVFVGRGALAEAVGRDRQDELLLRLQPGQALERHVGDFARILARFLAVLGASTSSVARSRASHLKIGARFRGASPRRGCSTPMPMTLSPSSSLMPRIAGRVRPLNTRTSGHREADALAVRAWSAGCRRPPSRSAPRRCHRPRRASWRSCRCGSPARNR